MSKGVYKLNIDCGRMGSLEGVFIATKEQIDFAIGRHHYFGEVLGKHSDIYGELESDEVEFITDDSNVIEIMERHNLCSGFNPLHYLGEDELSESEFKEWERIKKVS